MIQAPRRSLAVVLISVAMPSLVYGLVVVNHYDGRPYLRGDCPYYFAAAVSLLEDRDLDLANQLPGGPSQHAGYLALDRQNRFVPKHPVLLSVAAMPLIAMLGERGALLFNLVQLALLSAATCLLAMRYASPAAAGLAAMLTGTLSFLPHYAWNFSPDVFATLLLMIGLVVLVSEGPLTNLRQTIAGASLGLACVAKFPLLFALGPLVLLCPKPRLRALRNVGFGLAVPWAAFAALNYHLFGSPLVTSYDRLVRFTAGGIEVFSQRDDFTHPILQGIVEQFFDGVHGLLYTSPVTVLALLGLPFLFRRNWRIALYFSVFSLALYLFFASYRHWSASHYGNRFLLPFVVLAVVPLAALLDGYWERFGNMQPRDRNFRGSRSA